MTAIMKPGAGFLFMKVGTHARESLEDIIARKSKEIADTGFAMWGYGGSTCHPRSLVQPFAEEFAGLGKPIILCMQAMKSSHWAEQLRASEFSPDGLEWKPIQDTINVLGSRYALLIKNLRQEEHTIPLNQTSVANGPSRGRLGTRYLRGRVDKACLEFIEVPELANQQENELVKINLVADLVEPYAVFLRDHK